jgi:hypothetical protein
MNKFKRILFNLRLKLFGWPKIKPGKNNTEYIYNITRGL